MNMLMYEMLQFIRSEAQSGNEALLIRMQIPGLIREAIRYMSDTDLITLLQTHPDLITLEFDEALITQILDKIETGTPSSEIKALINVWFRDHFPGNEKHKH